MINYNGIDLSQYMNFKSIKRPILPPQKLSTLSIVGKDGAFFFRKKNDPTIIKTVVKIKATSRSALRSKVRDIADSIFSDGEVRIIFSDEPDRYIMGTVTDNTDLDELSQIGEGKIDFYCSDPYYYAINDDVKLYNSAGLKSFTRQGTAPSFPRFEIKGTNSGGGITILCNGKSMTFNGSLISTDTLIIDSQSITAYVLKLDGTKIPVMNNLDNLDFPVFGKGQVDVTFSTSGGATITQANIYCNSRWR